METLILLGLGLYLFSRKQQQQQQQFIPPAYDNQPAPDPQPGTGGATVPPANVPPYEPQDIDYQTTAPVRGNITGTEREDTNYCLY